MAYTHEVQTVDGTGAGFLSGLTLAILAVVLAVVVAGAVLLATRPWDDNGNGNGITNNNSVPSNNQDTGNSGAQPNGQ